jgi:5'-3' exonuclease
MTERRPLLAVDAPSLLFRAFHALPKSIKDSEGRAVNALLGTTNMLLYSVEEHEPRAVVLCFGPDAADYRVELYPPYHAARPPVPHELQPQFDAAPVFFEAFGWSVVRSEDLEADDLLGSLAAAEHEDGGSALILTGDRDMFQCVGEGVTMLYLRTGVRGTTPIDAAEVERRYGIPPRLVPDFIALRGDPSDGLPGARGIGEKTAADLLRRHGSLEAAIEAAQGGKAKALTDAADELRAFREIATLRRIPIELPADRTTDREGGARAARALGMERLAKRLEGEES